MPRKKSGDSEQPEQKHPGGRPSLYSKELAALICERISSGQSMRTLCAADDMPSPASVYLWLQQYPEFSEQYAKATEERAHSLAEEALEIADDGRNDYMASLGEGEETLAYRLNGEHVQRSRLRVDTRKWFAAKLAPKKYGERQTLEHTDPTGKNPFDSLMALIATNGRPGPQTNS